MYLYVPYLFLILSCKCAKFFLGLKKSKLSLTPLIGWEYGKFNSFNAVFQNFWYLDQIIFWKVCKNSQNQVIETLSTLWWSFWRKEQEFKHMIKYFLLEIILPSAILLKYTFFNITAFCFSTLHETYQNI